MCEKTAKTYSLLIEIYVVWPHGNFIIFNYMDRIKISFFIIFSYIIWSCEVKMDGFVGVERKTNDVNPLPKGRCRKIIKFTMFLFRCLY